MKNHRNHLREIYRVSNEWKCRGQATWRLIGCAALCIAVVFPNSLIADDSGRLTVSEMMELRPEQRERIDLMEATIACAEGLTGSEDINSEQSLKIFQKWTETAREETDRMMEEFRSHPHQSGISEARLKAGALIRIVREVLKVDYETSQLPADSLQSAVDMGLSIDSRHVFLTGVVNGKCKGTCVSMPFLYLAIGRRLNYPPQTCQRREPPVSALGRRRTFRSRLAELQFSDGVP